MRFHRIYMILLAVIFLFVGILPSCASKHSDPHAILMAMCDAEKPLPAGHIYVLSALEESPEYLPRDLVKVCFGNGKTPPEMDGVLDAALFFSYGHPCELAVFLCQSSANTESVAKMCLRRLDAVKNYYATAPDIDEEKQAYLNNACVTVRGRYVILCISSDPAAALRAVKRNIL